MCYGKIIDLGRFLPLAPILIAAFVLQWLNLTLSAWETGWSMAVHEQWINKLAGRVLLSHELTLWRQRTNRFSTNPRILILGALVGSTTYFLILNGLLQESRLTETPGAGPLIWVLASLIIFLILTNLRNMWGFFKDPRRKDLIEPSTESVP